MQVITLMNEKGGVGKTTLAVTLAAGLAIKGYRVLLVDTDPQGNATLALGLNRDNAFFNLICNDGEWQNLVRVIPPEVYTIPDDASDVKGILAVLPSSIQSRAIIYALESDPTFKLLARVSELVDIFDFVIFDTSPTPSLIHTMIQVASDGILYPTDLEYFGVDGLDQTLTRREEVNMLRRAKGFAPLRVFGIIPNRTRLNTFEHAEKMQILVNAYGREIVFKPIPQRTAWAEANAIRRTIFGYDPNQQAYEDAWAFVNRFLRVAQNV